MGYMQDSKFCLGFQLCYCDFPQKSSVVDKQNIVRHCVEKHYIFLEERIKHTQLRAYMNHKLSFNSLCFRIPCTKSGIWLLLLTVYFYVHWRFLLFQFSVSVVRWFFHIVYVVTSVFYPELFLSIQLLLSKSGILLLHLYRRSRKVVWSLYAADFHYMAEHL